MCYSPEAVNLEGVGLTTVTCGKCLQCLRTKRNDWTFRLTNEAKHSYSAAFLTLTYNPSKLPLSTHFLPTLSKDDYTAFIKAVRYENKKHIDMQIRYYGVGEYGKKFERPHYHFIMFNAHEKTLNKLPKIWNKGQIHIGSASPAAIRYVTKYLINRQKDQDLRTKEFATMSRRPAIGEHYLHTHFEYHRDNASMTAELDGVKMILPRYYREKMFSKDEREELNAENQKYRDEMDNYTQELIEKRGDNYFEHHQQLKEAETRIFKEKFNKKAQL